MCRYLCWLVLLNVSLSCSCSQPSRFLAVPYFLSAVERATLPHHLSAVVHKQEAAISLALRQLEAVSFPEPAVYLPESSLSAWDFTSLNLNPAFHQTETQREPELIISAKTTVNEQVEKSSCLTWKRRFEWAWFTVNTRAVYLAADPREASGSWGSGSQSAEDSLALAPYLDLLNHSGSVKVQAGINIHPTNSDRQVFITLNI